MQKPKLAKQSGEMPWRIDAILSTLTELNDKDREFIKGLVMQFIEYSLDELEVAKTIILEDTEHHENKEMLRPFATKIMDLTIRAKKELECKL